MRSIQQNCVRPLRSDEAQAAARLSDAAGWNQTEEDWRRFIELGPGSCFGIDCGGRLAATSGAVCYGRKLAWIGMVLTLPEHRGQGLARRVFERTIQHLDAAGVQCLRLDATGMGVDLYGKYGFLEEYPVERWSRPA